MILLTAVLIGLAAGFGRATRTQREYFVQELRWIWLVPVAFLPQFAAFLFPATRESIPDLAARVILVGSQIILLIFAWANRRQAGFWALTLGLGLNLVVIVANHGFMPIDPETVQRLAPDAPAGAWTIGARLGVTKDIVLAREQTRLGLFADRFLIPDWSPYRVAFSLGDVLISIGAFWFFFVNGRPLWPAKLEAQ